MIVRKNTFCKTVSLANLNTYVQLSLGNFKLSRHPSILQAKEEGEEFDQNSHTNSV